MGEEFWGQVSVVISATVRGELTLLNICPRFWAQTDQNYGGTMSAAVKGLKRNPVLDRKGGLFVTRGGHRCNGRKHLTAWSHQPFIVG